MVAALKLCPLETYGAWNPYRPWGWSLRLSFSLRDLWAQGTYAGLGAGHRAQALPLRDYGSQEPVPVLELATALKVIADLCPFETYGRREPVLALEMVAALKLCPFETYEGMEPVQSWELATALKLCPFETCGHQEPVPAWELGTALKLCPPGP